MGDGSVRLTVLGAPRTLKNRGEVVLVRGGDKGQPCPRCGTRLITEVHPSRAWRRWLARAIVRVEGRYRLVHVPQARRWMLALEDSQTVVPARPWTPISRPVNCRAVFYREAERGDLIGYCQGLADLLQATGVVEDDLWIRGWDGTRLARTRQGPPRVEVELTPLGEAEPDAHGEPDAEPEGNLGVGGVISGV